MSIDSFPTTNSGPKAVIVEGGNIQINTDITNYDTGTNVLILIARKNTITNTGGNIYINPSVTHIDAIIIVDGAVMNADATGVKNWINDASLLGTPLRINGRLYSFNTRG